LAKVKREHAEAVSPFQLLTNHPRISNHYFNSFTPLSDLDVLKKLSKEEV
jgi:hypothetical protein